MSRKSSITTTRQKQTQAAKSSDSGKSPTRGDAELLEGAVARLAAYIRRHAVPLQARGARP
ncbi:MAG: hypothetical protein ACYC05_04975 [Sulfuricella sp.]